MPRRPRLGGMDGVLIVAKPAGPTSHDIVGLVRRLTATPRVGHGGTLDPFASGVLPIFLGRATRLAEYHLGEGKAYRATVCFGAASTTDDLEGELTRHPGPAPAREAVESALAAVRGPIEQVPPAYSAIQIEGRRAYAMARSGEKPELRPRSVTIGRLDLAEWDASDPERPVAVLEIECSAGTYIRAIARDLGVAVGSAAYLGTLTRTASGHFTLADAVPVDLVRSAAAEGPVALRALLRPVDTGLDAWPAIRLDPAEIADITRGRFVRPHDPAARPTNGPVRLLDGDGRIVAVAAWRDGRIAPQKVLTDIVPAPGPAGEDDVPPGAPAPDTGAPGGAAPGGAAPDGAEPDGGVAIDTGRKGSGADG
jgi:tRNA pseudouridine55 synthase